MDSFDDILESMYSSRGFATKGRAKNLKDAFLTVFKHRPYVVFITENSKLDGNDLRFDYSIFSITDQIAVCKDTEEYRELVDSLPQLDGLSYYGSVLDFSQMIILEDTFRGLAARFLENGSLTDTEAEQYQEYLTNMKRLKSPSFQTIYDYFSQTLGR